MNLQDLIPPPVRSLLPPIALGLGVAVLLYAGISIALTMSVDAPSTAAAAVEEDLPASQVVSRFATALVAGDKDAMARYAAAELVEGIDADMVDQHGPADHVAREIRRRIGDRGLVRVDIERMAPQHGTMGVDVTIHVFDAAHFERWAEHNPDVETALDQAIAYHATQHSDPETSLTETDRATNLVTVAEAGADAFAAVQKDIASVKQSYIDDFFNAVGPDAEYMLVPLPTVTFLLERRSDRWIIVSQE